MHKPKSRFTAFFAGILVVFAGVTCTDSPTGPRSGRGGSALVGFAPLFSQAAADIYRSLANFQLAVDNIHVRLEHANGETAKDSVVVLSAGQDSVVIELSVTLNGSTELLEAQIELRDGNTVLFSGTQDINARAGGFPTTTPAIELDYTGPGFRATTFDVGPGDTTLISTDSVTFQASAKDANGQNVSDIVVAWSVKDAARGTVDNAGKFKPSAGRGETYVLAALPSGLKDSGHVNVVPPATKAVVISGGTQTGTVGKPLAQPIVIEAQASDNLPVPTAKLTFAVTSGGGSVSTGTATTDANGRASVLLTLGNAAGTNAIEVAGVGIQPINISATGAPDVAAKLVMSQQPSLSVIPNVTFPQQPKVQIQDALGNAVALSNAPVTAALTDAAGRTLSGTLTVNTNDAGIAEFTDLKIAGPVGTTTLTFTAANITAASTSSMTLALGPPASVIAVSGDGQGSLPSQTLANPLVVKILDVGGNILSGTSVTFNVTSGGGNLAGVQSATISTDASGQASTPWSVGTGVQALTATAGGVTRELRAFIAEKVVITAPLPLSPQSGVAMNPQPVVRLADTQGNFVKLAGVDITANAEPTPPFGDYAFFVTGGGVVTTDANGVATFTTVAVQGDIEQHGVVKFYRLIGESTDPSIAPGISAEIAMQPGIPQQLVAEDFVEYHRMPAPTSTKTLAVVASDGYNNVPNWPIAFGVVSGASNCSITTTPATVNTDALGKASVNVATLASMSSCVVRAEVVFPPPPPCPECPPATTPSPPQMAHRVYVVPTSVAVWTGVEDNTFGTSGPPSNWLGSVAPTTTDDVFIPAASFYNNPNTPTVTAVTQLKSLTIENGASLSLAGQTLNLTADLAARGPIEGGTVVMQSTETSPHFVSGTINALLKVGLDSSLNCPGGTQGIYLVNAPLNADNVLANCSLQLTEEHNVVVAGDINVAGPWGALVQSKGQITVKNRVSFNGGTSLFADGLFNVDGTLNVAGSAALHQSGGTVTVGGDATFNGIEQFIGGVLELKKNFTFTGDCSTATFWADEPHTIRLTGGNTTDQLQFKWTPCEDRIGRLEVMTSGLGVALLAATGAETLALRSILVERGAILEIRDNLFISGDPDVGHIDIKADGKLRILTAPPTMSCSPIAIVQGENVGPIFCTFLAL